MPCGALSRIAIIEFTLDGSFRNLDAMKRSRRIPASSVFAVLVILLLAACTEEAPGPQFANNPVATRVPTEAAGAATPAVLPRATPALIATPASIGEILRTRGAASHVYVASDDAVWSITSEGEGSRIYTAPEGARILAVDSAPGGMLVAVLLQHAEGDGTEHELVVVDDAGDAIGQWVDFTAESPTPVPRPVAAANLVDWSPQGDRILVGFRDGSLFDVQLAEDGATALSIGPGEGQVLQPAWSPTGEAVAYVAASNDERQRTLQIYHAGSGEISTVVDPPDGRFVVEFVWMPDGVSLLFTEGGELGGAVSGIDLWRVKADGESRELLASAGMVAPVAQIGTMRPSPDGRSVAYVVLVPGEGAPRVDSVWVKDLVSGVGFRIPLPSIASVEDLWWTNRGLVISVTTTGSDSDGRPILALLQLRQDGVVSILWVAPLGPATPPDGTPAATPGAQPEG